MDIKCNKCGQDIPEMHDHCPNCGEVKIIETEDEFGEFHYQYQVKEQNKNRNFDMDEPGHHDDDDDEDSQNQNENEHQNGLDEENTEEETDEVL